MARRGLLQRAATRAALVGGSGTSAPAGRPGQNTPARGGRVVGTTPVTYTSPGQPMQLQWDAGQAIDNVYSASMYAMRCLRCIAQDIAGLDLRWGNDPRQPNAFNPQAYGARLLGPAMPGGQSGAPNRTTSTRALVAWSLIQYLVTGRYGWEFERDQGQGAIQGPDGGGLIVGLWPLVSRYLDAVPALDTGTWWDQFIYHLPQGDRFMPPDRLHYAWRPGASDWRQPESYLQGANFPVAIQTGIDRYTVALLRNNMVATTMVVSPPFELAEDREAWQEQFLQEYSGVDQAGGTVFGEFEPDERTSGQNGRTSYVQVERIGQTATDGQLLELGRDAKDDICIMAGVPRSRVGDASRRTYSNAGQEYKNYWEGTLLPIIAEWQDHVNTDLAPRLGTERMWVDLSRVESLRATSLLAPPALKDALDEGVLTVEQAQDMLGVDTYADEVDTETALEGGADFGSSGAIKVGGGGRSAAPVGPYTGGAHRRGWQYPGAMNTTVYADPQATRDAINHWAEQRVRGLTGAGAGGQHTRALAPADVADKVHGYLSRSYPAKVLDWVHDADWSGPRSVPLDQVQMDRRPGGRDLEKVDGMAAQLRAGKRMDPVVLVDTGDEKLKVADGYHRTLAHRRAGRARVTAFVAKVDDKQGPWDRQMHDAKLNRSAAAEPDELALALGGWAPWQQQLRYDVSPLGAGKNWVTKVGGLPLFIRAIAHALMRSGRDESSAIQVAVGTVQRWARGEGKVTPKTRAKAAAALAEWEAKKAKAHVSRGAAPDTKHLSPLRKPHTCKYGAHPATKAILWAEGRAYVPVCAQHYDRAVTKIGGPTAVDKVYDLPQQRARDRAPRPRRRRRPAQRDVVTEGGSAGLLLPKGQPEPPKPRRATVRPHAPRGADAARCAKCGRPFSDQVHQRVRHRGPDGHHPVPTGHRKAQARGQLAALESARGQLEGGLQSAVAALLDKQRDATLARLTGKRGKQMLARHARAQHTRADPPATTPPAGQPAAVDVGSIFDAGFWQQQLLQALEATYQGAAQLAVQQVRTQAELPGEWAPESVSDQAVRLLLDARANRMAQSITETTWQALVRELNQGVVEGEPMNALAGRVRQVLGSAANARRAETIARTEVVSALAGAAHQYATDAGPDVVAGKRWLSHHDERTRPTHVAADLQERQVGDPFEVGDADLQHPGDPTGPPGEVINCVVGGTRVEWAGELLGAYRRWYQGDVVEIVTADGDRLTVTPNHPVLTDRGWAPAQLIHQGDKLASAHLVERGPQPDVDHVPPRVEEVYRAACQQWPASRVVGRAVDFHGDGGDGEVDVVRADGHLPLDVEADGDQVLGHEFLVGARRAERYGSGPGGAEVAGGGRPVALGRAGAPGLVGGGGELAAVGAGQSTHPQAVRLGPGPGLQPELSEPPGYAGAVDAEEPGHRQDAHAILVASTQVVEVNVRPFSGHVYNLMTSGGWFLGANVAQHNCRCGVAYLPAAHPVVGPTEGGTE